MQSKFGKIKAWFEKYEAYISTGSLLLGFAIDNLTLKRIDLPFENIVLFTYLAISAIGITLINLYDTGKLHEKLIEKTRFLLPHIVQFAFGGLFSGFFVFYSGSASFFTSWPFLVLLLVIMVGGERFKHYYLRIGFQVGVLYIALFSFSIFYIPVLTGKMGVWTFLLSGLSSLVIIALFLRFLLQIVPDVIKKNKRIIGCAVGGAFFLINIFYFANILPPIPLALKDGGIYHSLVKRDGEYWVKEERGNWNKFFSRYDVIHLSPGASLYAYSSVFAPTNLNTNIVHNWQYFDKQNDKWVSASRIIFPIVGGRDGGYRGYSWKSSLFPALWRVDVETLSGQIIGRIKFRIEISGATLQESQFRWVEGK